MSDRPGSGRRGRSLEPRRIVAVVLVALFVLFAVQNRGDTLVQLLLFDITGPLWLTLLLTFVLGGVVGWLLVGRRGR